jgi:hypothetical protein
MANSIKRFEDIEVWQKAVDFATEIYKISDIGKLNKDFDAKVNDNVRHSLFQIILQKDLSTIPHQSFFDS